MFDQEIVIFSFKIFLKISYDFANQNMSQFIDILLFLNAFATLYKFL